ncbi:hypothetical protein ABPG74_005757 [Tetrahymena malaccensis]
MNYILIDSCKSDPQNFFDFRVQLNEKIKVTKYIKLVKCTIPYDDYLINQYNNSFQVNSKTYNIPFGIYDIISLTNQMKSLVQTDLSSFNISFSQITYRLTFSATSNFSMTLNKSLSSILGFQQIQFLNSNSYTSTKTPVINSPQVVLINIKEIPDSQIVQTQNYDVDFSFTVLNTTNRGQNIQYQNQSDENTIEARCELRQLSVQLYKNDGSFFMINSGVQLLFQYE